MKHRSTVSGDAISFLGKYVFAKIDRPLGSKHPEWDIIYPINYGYIPGVITADGEDLDAYVLGLSIPVESFEGICIAVIHRLDDRDDKLVLAPEKAGFSDADIIAMTNFQEQYFLSKILRK